MPDPGIYKTINEDALNITVVGAPTALQLGVLGCWIADNRTVVLGKKAVIVDLSPSSYVGSQLAGLVIGLGKMRLDAGLSLPGIVGGSEFIRHLFEVTCTSLFVKFLGE